MRPTWPDAALSTYFKKKEARCWEMNRKWRCSKVPVGYTAGRQVTLAVNGTPGGLAMKTGVERAWTAWHHIFVYCDVSTYCRRIIGHNAQRKVRLDAGTRWYSATFQEFINSGKEVKSNSSQCRHSCSDQYISALLQTSCSRCYIWYVFWSAPSQSVIVMLRICSKQKNWNTVRSIRPW